jgi:hypothetical protein
MTKGVYFLHPNNTNTTNGEKEFEIDLCALCVLCGKNMKTILTLFLCALVVGCGLGLSKVAVSDPRLKPLWQAARIPA